MSTEYATPENNLPYEPNLHISGTITRNRNGKTLTEFWLSRPRPEGMGIDEWDKLETEKWNRIWGKNSEGG